MYIKIYFNDKPLFLCDNIDEVVEPFVHHDDAVFIDELDTHTVKSMIYEMQLEKIHAGVFFHSNLDELKKAFFKKFTLVQAAGGLVKNGQGENLVIFRRGKWDLPKGKLDKGESLEECAVREVEEETGLQNIKLLAPLLVTYHTYHEGTKFILKESHWYKMQTLNNQDLVPQTEEDIQQVIWVDDKDLSKYMKDAFPSVVDVLKAGRSK
ncbi:NUDIX hydrolase [Terrimonas pollutisoli]|uniref:NUDIX hydrolase n=1 Tax=Terrimonas pollutisoli TaxID=3034147 RepID=UPI0023EDD001|nr:NUDIX domain-containing protein [Terrimonas sp. H1YJ31]